MNNDSSFEEHARHFIEFWLELQFQGQNRISPDIIEKKTNNSKWDGNEVDKQLHG